MVSDRDLFLAYGALMSGAVLPIYHGAYASLRTPLSTIKARKEARKGKGAKDDDSDEDETVTLPETLTAEDAYWLPVIGSVVLFSMFLVFKYLDKIWVDRVLGFYFGMVGTFSVTKVLLLILGTTGVLSHVQWARYHLTKTVRKEGKADVQDMLTLRLTVLHPAVVVAAAGTVGAYLWTRNWITCNFIALSLSLSSISMLSLDSFQTGGIMLMGLFLYDIFWVFGTNVMVSVARGFDGPIKIVWPKNLVAGLLDSSAKWQMTMLGLGDIVIPGIFIALALRFDQHLYVTANPKALISKHDTTFAKPYFQATLIGYVAGLATTMGVMHFTGAAQPALLYLSPACILAVALCALRRGEVQRAWSWSDDEGKDDEKKGDSGSESSKTTASTKKRSKAGKSNGVDGIETDTASTDTADDQASSIMDSTQSTGTAGSRRRRKAKESS